MNKACKALGIICLTVGSAAVASACVPAVAAPEVDPASAGSAIALVSGVLLLFGARRIRS